MIRGVIFGVLISISACTIRPDNAENVRSEAFEMLQNYHEAMRSEGLLAEFDFLDDSDQFFWVPPGYNAPLDYDSVQTILERNAGTIVLIRIEWEQLEVIPLAENIATFHGTVHSIMTDTSGQVNDSRLLESGTLIRRSDGWKLLCGQSRILRD